MNDLEALYQRLAAKAMAKADLPPETPSVATRFVIKRYKRMAPPLKTHCIRGHERTVDNLTESGTCRECGPIRHAEKRNRDRNGAFLADKVSHRPKDRDRV